MNVHIYIHTRASIYNQPCINACIGPNKWTNMCTNGMPHYQWAKDDVPSGTDKQLFSGAGIQALDFLVGARIKVSRETPIACCQCNSWVTRRFICKVVYACPVRWGFSLRSVDVAAENLNLSCRNRKAARTSNSICRNSQTPKPHNKLPLPGAGKTYFFRVPDYGFYI